MRLLGADIEAIRAGEDRQRFKEIVDELDRSSAPRARGQPIAAHDGRMPRHRRSDLGYPVVVRPSFTLGGKGGGIAYDEARAAPHRRRRPRRQPDGQRPAQVLLEESILGWKEFELELMRDRADNVVVVCSIENVDPMGVHTGDSVTVAPAMTLTDREYQRMRDVAIAIMRAVGVDAGGCNIQFAVEPTHRPARRHRDEPAGLAQQRAGVQGHRLPDRQDQRQARPRLHARRDRQRHHPARPRRPSSRAWTTWWSRCRGSRSRSSPAPTRCSPRT